jgi:hypothetical protein
MSTRHLLAAFVLAPLLLNAQGQSTQLTAAQAIARIQQAIPQPPPSDTVDTIKAGDPSTIVTGIVTCFTDSMDVLRRAVSLHANLIVAHEPTFYNHRDESTLFTNDPVYKEKLAYIHDHHLVVWRFHDQWHLRRPEPMTEAFTVAVGWQKYQDAKDPFFFTLPPTTFLAIAATAQNNSSARHASGTVTGHVYCADTNAAARNAAVHLKPVNGVQSSASAHSDSTSDAPASGVVETALDGSFVIPRVAPGAYYVVVTAAGYLSTLGPHEDGAGDVTDAPKPPQPAAQAPVTIPRVDVQAEQTANIDVRIERGAAISGTIRYDDGTPAAGVIVSALYKSKKGWIPSQTGDFGAFAMPSSLTTDDLGHYRIGGLRDREYILQAMLFHMDLMPAGGSGGGLAGALSNALAIYSGDAMRKSDAVPFKLGPGEDRAGVDITIPLSKLHFITGVVTAAGDGHAINNGHISIEDPADKGEHVIDAELGKDGTFHLEGVPEGTYTLRIQEPSDKQAQEVHIGGEHHMAYTDERTLHQYSDLEQTLKVEGDIPSLVLTVTEKSKQHAAGYQ